MAKDFHDPSVFTDNVSALDLFNNSVRKSFNYDALTGPTYFAKVLSTPLPLNADQMASMLNLDPKVSKTAVDAATKANQKRVTSFYFKGRIEQLHGQFLDDPCDLSTATCPHAIKRLISDHTEFISEGINSEIPAVGDIVRVQLKPASNGPYDLQSGAYLGPTRTWSARSTAPGAGQSEQCYSAVANFDEENASTMGEVSPGTATSLGRNQAQSYTPVAEGERTIDRIVIHFTDGNCGSGRAQQTIDRMAEGPTLRYEVNGQLVPCTPVGGSSTNEDLTCMKRSMYNNIGGAALEKVVKTSIHYAIDQGGNIVAGVLEKDVAYHAAGVNSRSIGIEINGSDNLEKHPSCKPSMFTPTLMNTLAALVSEIAGRHSIPIDRTHIVGHDEYYSGDNARRRDPGTFASRNTAQVGHPSGWDWDIFIEATQAEAAGKPITLAQNSTSGAVIKSIVS